MLLHYSVDVYQSLIFHFLLQWVQLLCSFPFPLPLRFSTFACLVLVNPEKMLNNICISLDQVDVVEGHYQAVRRRFSREAVPRCGGQQTTPAALMYLSVHHAAHSSTRGRPLTSPLASLFCPCHLVISSTHSFDLI